MGKDTEGMAKKKTELQKVNVTTRNKDGLDKLFAKMANGEKLTATQQQKVDRYGIIIGLRTAGFSGRIYLKTLMEHKSGLFADLSESHINKLTSECINHFGNTFNINKQAERIFKALEFEEIALKLKQQADYDGHFKYSTEASKLKGLYEAEAMEVRVFANKLVLGDSEKAVKNLQSGVDFEEIDAEEDDTQL